MAITFNALGRYGRLGNQMFQIASVIGIAEANGYEYTFPEWVNYDALERFGTKEDIAIAKYFANPLPSQNEEHKTLPEYFVNWGWQGLQHPDGYSYSGHMQSSKYFNHCSGLIKYYFTMAEERNDVEYTAIHVRLGDYGSSYHPICSREYYHKAMAELPGPYMVFSEDWFKAREHLGPLPPGDHWWYDGNTIDTFRVMKACKNHIIANSTYSWWAAYLAGGNVVAPKEWFGPDAAHLETKDIYCDSWKIL